MIEGAPRIRYAAAITLGVLKDKRAIDPLINSLNDKSSQDVAADALIKMEDDISSLRAIKYWVARKYGSKLRENWKATKKVLLKDVDSNHYETIQNALYAFIGIGSDSIIPVLIAKLNTTGTKITAEAYLNSGQKELNEAAKIWAKKRGYIIMVGEGAHPVSWGKW